MDEEPNPEMEPTAGFEPSVLARILDASPHALVALIERDGRVAYVNAASRSLTGFEPAEVVGRNVAEFLPADSGAELLQIFRRIATRRPEVDRRMTVRHKDGRDVPISFSVFPFGEEGQVDGVVLTGHAAEIRPAEAEYAGAASAPWPNDALIERLPAVIYVAERGERGRWRYVSPQIEQLLGYSPREWVDDPELWLRSIHPTDRSRVLAEEARDVPHGAPAISEYRLRARDGSVIWVRDEALLRDDREGTLLYDGLLIDITDRKQLEARLQFLADHDALTGVWNRRRFLEELDSELKRQRRHGGVASLVMVDIDGLKAVNDTLGHGAGDKLIRLTADALGERLRESDALARLGGDEFAALLRGTGAGQADGVARDLAASIAERARGLARAGLSPGVSAGVAELRPALGPEEALAAADAAMYRAKRASYDPA